VPAAARSTSLARKKRLALAGAAASLFRRGVRQADVASAPRALDAFDHVSSGSCFGVDKLSFSAASLRGGGDGNTDEDYEARGWGVLSNTCSGWGWWSCEARSNIGQPGYRGRQLHDAMYGVQRKTSVENMLQLPAALREQVTVCVSSHVGCAMRCSFCATGRQGFRRNLYSAEIVNQVFALEDVFGLRATNVEFMGMGEPLLNLREVLRAHRCLNRDVGIGGRFFTISTVGVPNALSKLAAHKLQATLAVSLHAPDQALRERLVPTAKAYPLEALLEDARLYKKLTGRRVTFEYTLLAGENASPEQARALGRLLRSKVGRGSHVNLLPWNPVAGPEGLHRRQHGGAQILRRADAGEGNHAHVETHLRLRGGCGVWTTDGEVRAKTSNGR